MFLWMIRLNIIRTVPCCIVYDSCVHWYTHMSSSEQLTVCLFSCRCCFLLLFIPPTQLFYSFLDFVWENPGEPVPEETYTHSHLLWSSVVPYLFHPSIMIHGILPVHFTCLTVFFQNISPSFLWPIFWPDTLHFILHTFLLPIIVFFSQHMPYHRNLFCCSTEIISSNPSHSLIPLLGTLSCSFTPHIHLTILISAHWSATSFSFLTGQVSLPCNILLRTQLLYNLPLTINDISLLVSSGTNCLNLFRPIRILVSTAASTYALPILSLLLEPYQNLFPNLPGQNRASFLSLWTSPVFVLQ